MACLCTKFEGSSFSVLKNMKEDQSIEIGARWGYWGTRSMSPFHRTHMICYSPFTEIVGLSCSFWDIASLSKVTNFFLPHIYMVPPWLTHGIASRTLASGN